MDEDQVPWSPETRRAPATASSGSRPGRLQPPPTQRRPVTSIGASLFHLDAAPTAAAAKEEGSDFDVRKFLLAQTATGVPLHKSSLFRSELAPLAARATKKKTKTTLPVMDEEAASVSHFYTIEKLAESCFHAVQSKQHKTWQFLPGAEERSKSSSGTSANANANTSLTGVERPSRRVDVLDLDRCLDTAMRYVKSKHHRGGGGDAAQLSTLERDVMTIEAKVAQQYESYHAAEEGEEAKKKTQEQQQRLARTLFEQKWADVVLGEVEAMLTSSFLEQGALVRKTRIQYARSFFRLERLYSEQARALAAALASLRAAERSLKEASESHALDTQEIKAQYEAEIRRLSVGFETRRDELERRAAESKEQMSRMGDTMKTLNTVFRQMREDTDKVKAVELRENYVKLERKHEACREELERLRPLVQINHKLHEQQASLAAENQQLGDKIAAFDHVLAAKDEAIASLMEQQSELLAAQELRAAQDEERARIEQAEKEEDEEEDAEPESVSQAKAAAYTGQRRNSAVVCVRCKESLRSQSQTGLLSASSNQPPSAGHDSELDAGGSAKDQALDVRKRRVQCMYFRILLPNLRGRRPQRDQAWTLSCMRAIVLAKQLDDALCKSSSGGACALRVRMPEFVYAWFSPWKSLREERRQRQLTAAHGDDLSLDEGSGGGGVNHERIEEQRQLQADEDRWCLYYGVKALVQEGFLEAKLFLSLLDEKCGEDEQVFMLYCYRVLDVLLGGRLHYGPLRELANYAAFQQRYDALLAARHSATDLLKTIHAARPRVPKTIWITPRHAALATDLVLAKASDLERQGVHKKLLEFAVTNLATDERPAVYMAPASSTRRRQDQQDAEEEEEDAVQFVDANLWVELMMMEYKEEQAHRRAAIRLMFQTATALSSSSSSPNRSIRATAASMDMEQFRIMVHTLNDELPSFLVASLYRAAFLRGQGSVTFDSFLDAAEYAQFFSSCLRLEPPAVAVARLPLTLDGHAPTAAALSTSARAAFVADKLFTLLHAPLSTLTRELPLCTRSLADRLLSDLAAVLLDNAQSRDGVELLATFHRLVDALLLAALARKDATGLALSSKTIASLERALHALLECVRAGDKSSAEQLVDAVRHKLSVQRVQALFRRHLARHAGAPLAMRPLLRRENTAALRARRAERPLPWLRFVVADAIRRSLRSDRVHWLLLELSSVSSGAKMKPLFVEVVYDGFVDKFGTRGEAEKLLHDAFFTCRQHASTDSLALLFAGLCGMGEDQFLAQNEALAFLHAVVRCQVHAFHVINPPPPAAAATADKDPHEDCISLAAAAQIADAAFAKLSADHRQLIKMRLEEKAAVAKTLRADLFLVAVLHEWKLYVQHRQQELRDACRAMETELSPLASRSLPVDLLATVLQKAGVTASNEELCVVFRRLCLTEPRATPAAKQASATTSSIDQLSDRVASACYPLVAKETLVELQRLEHAAATPFKLLPAVDDSAKFLVETWRGYAERCLALLDALRRMGKNNDIQAEAISRRAPGLGGRAVQREVLHLSTSTAAGTLSSQDVAQLDALVSLFLERLERMNDELRGGKEEDAAASHRRRRASVVALTELATNGAALDEDARATLADAHSLVVNEAWRLFRQVVVSVTRLRALAGMGLGPLPDKWDPPDTTTSEATTQ